MIQTFLKKFFWIWSEGSIKKVSHGPVVTLNEFEPAAAKVSKIINLSDDIARNTSSESARISTIPEVILLVLNYPKLQGRMYI